MEKTRQKNDLSRKLHPEKVLLTHIKFCLGKYIARSRRDRGWSASARKPIRQLRAEAARESRSDNNNKSLLSSRLASVCEEMIRYLREPLTDTKEKGSGVDFLRFSS